MDASDPIGTFKFGRKKTGHSHVQGLPQLDQNRTGRRDPTVFKILNLGKREAHTLGHFVHRQTSGYSRRLQLLVNHLLHSFDMMQKEVQQDRPAPRPKQSA
jgi:hypothetical protein